MKFIDNPPTTENLKELYNSTSYQNLLIEFEKQSNHKLEKEEDAVPDLYKYLNFIQRRYLILNIPFEEVCVEFEKLKEKLLGFTIRSIDFFVAEETNADGEFPEGEEPDEEEDHTYEEGGVSRTFILDKFCEAYLLELGDKERLLHFLKTTRMPYAEQYLRQITKLYFA